MRSRLVPFLALVLAALACNLGREAASSSVTEAGIPFSATPIRFVIPAGLAEGASAETIDVVTDQTGAPWDVAPAHLQLTFQGYELQSTFHVPQMFVYPAQQYESMNRSAAETLKRLRSVLANPSGSHSQDTLPRVPFYNAGQVIAAQEKVIHFSGGSGVRFITQYGQDISPINNDSLFYHFAGLTDDGQYYIVAILPVNLPFLAADNNPASPVPAGGVPFPPASATGSDFQSYFSAVTQRIDEAASEQFDPPLDKLDALITSLTANP